MLRWNWYMEGHGTFAVLKSKSYKYTHIHVSWTMDDTPWTDQPLQNGSNDWLCKQAKAIKWESTVKWWLPSSSSCSLLPEESGGSQLHTCQKEHTFNGCMLAADILECTIRKCEMQYWQPLSPKKQSTMMALRWALKLHVHVHYNLHPDIGFQKTGFNRPSYGWNCSLLSAFLPPHEPGTRDNSYATHKPPQ